MYQCCNDDAIKIDIDYLLEWERLANNEKLSGIFACNFFTIISTIVGFATLLNTIIRWNTSNPSDGLRAARKIKVGIAEGESNLDNASHECGQPVPEADREVIDMPSQLQKRLSV